MDPGDNFFEVLESCESILKDQFTEDISSKITTTQLLRINHTNTQTFKAPEYLTRNDMRTIECNVTEKSLGKKDDEEEKKEEEEVDAEQENMNANLSENMDANLSDPNASKKRKENKNENKTKKKRRTSQDFNFNSSDAALTYNQQGKTKFTKVADNTANKIWGTITTLHQKSHNKITEWLSTNHKLSDEVLKDYELKLALERRNNRFVFHYHPSNKNRKAQYVDKIELKFDVSDNPAVGCELYFTTLFDQEAHPNDIKTAVEIFVKETICFHFRLLFTFHNNNKNDDPMEVSKTNKYPL